MIDFSMKVLIAILLCALMQTYCVAVLNERTGNQKLNELLRDATNECIREMNRDPRFINDKDPPSDPCIVEDPNMVVCTSKKMGLMNDDGSYNLERILTFADTAEDRQRIVEKFNGKIKECSSKAGGDPCKAAACVHRLSESWCGRVPNEDDGC